MTELPNSADQTDDDILRPDMRQVDEQGSVQPDVPEELRDSETQSTHEATETDVPAASLTKPASDAPADPDGRDDRAN